MKIKRVLEVRTLPSLIEQSNDIKEELETIVADATKENRTITEEDSVRVDELNKELNLIERTIELEKETRDLKTKKTKKKEDRAVEDIFSDFIKGETRSLGEMDTTVNGNIVPDELSSDILKKVAELSGLFGAVRKVNSTGTYQQIIEKDKATAGWTDELAEVTKTSGDYELIEIGHHKLGALTKISLEIINQANFNVTSEVIDQISRSFAEKVEEAFIKGTGIKQPTGLVSSGVKVELASNSAITGDELVDIFHSLKAPYLPKSVWLMSRGTLASIRKLKDEAGQYLFQEDMTKAYVGFILGKPVIISEYVDAIGENANPIIFGDLSTSYIANVNPQQTIQMLNEVYATQGAKGVLGFLFIDGKPVNDEAYVVTVCPGV